MKMQTIDLSQPLSAATPVYPGDAGPHIEVLSQAAEPTAQAGRSLNNSRLSVGVHNGTHIDAPFHFFADRDTIDRVPLDRCTGPALRIDLRRTQQPGIISAADLQPHDSQRGECKIVLLFTGWDQHWGQPDYFSAHPVMTQDAARLLVEWGVELVGVDFPSVDREPFEAHLALLGNDVLIVENLTRLGELQPRCEFFAVPLPIVGRDASPIRAFARQAATEPSAASQPAQVEAVSRVSPESLSALVQEIFTRSGSSPHEAGRLAFYLVESNLAGHDSHGVIRVPYYVDYVRNGQVVPNQHAQVVSSQGCILVVEGGSGFGQVVTEEAMQMAIERSAESGVCVLALRNCGHMGRIGDWPLMAARAGKVSLHFVNTSGFGLLVAPFGGIDRRLSANPVAAGIPVEHGEPIILDISTCAIAEGKLKVARNKGVKVPSGCIIDAQGNSTDDPRDFYTQPPGAILPFGGHKGFGLGVITEILAGAVAGNGCSKPGADRLLNGMLAIIVDPQRLPTDVPLAKEVAEFVAFVKSSRKVAPDTEIMLPGEPEARTRSERLAQGIPLDTRTRSELIDVATSLGVSGPLVDAIRD